MKYRLTIRQSNSLSVGFVLATIAIIQILKQHHVPIWNGPPIVVAAVSLANLLGDGWAVALNAALGMGYAYAFFSNPSGLGQFTDTNASRVIILWMTFPAQAVAMGYLKHLSHQESRKIEQLHKEALVHERKYRALYDANPNAILTLSADGTITQINQQAKRLGMTLSRCLGRNWVDCVDPDGYDSVSEALSLMSRGQSTLYEVQMSTPQGRISLEITQLPIKDGIDISGGFVIAHDISARKQRQSQVEYMAYHDSLTELGNRRYLTESLTQTFKQVPAVSIGMAFIDIDYFKRINDNLGHARGDAILRLAASRLRQCTPPKGTVSRVGGDEFCVVLSPITDRDEMENFAARLLEEFRQPLHIEGHAIELTLSIGLAWREAYHAVTMEDLIRMADTAVYRAKRDGRNQYQWAACPSAPLRPAISEEEMAEAVRDHQLVLHYQAVVEPNGHLIGGEALVRWQHPHRGLLMPPDFLSNFTDSGHGDWLDYWVMTRAFEQMHAWETTLNLAPDFRVGVNVTPDVLTNPRFLHHFEQILTASGVRPHRLVLEVPETLVLANASNVWEIFGQLKALGLRLSLDDFGEGYTSLGHLRRIPFDSVKIDRQFINGIGQNAFDEHVVRHVVDIARQLDMKVVAEGVETAEQYAFVVDVGCQLIQGYMIGKPVPAERFTPLGRVTIGLPLATGPSLSLGGVNSPR